MAQTQTVTETIEYDKAGRVAKKTTVTHTEEGPQPFKIDRPVTPHLPGTPWHEPWTPTQPFIYKTDPRQQYYAWNDSKTNHPAQGRPRLWLLRGGLQESLDRD